MAFAPRVPSPSVRHHPRTTPPPPARPRRRRAPNTARARHVRMHSVLDEGHTCTRRSVLSFGLVLAGAVALWDVKGPLRDNADDAAVRTQPDRADGAERALSRDSLVRVGAWVAFLVGKYLVQIVEEFLGGL